MPLRIAQLVPSLKPTGPVRVALDIGKWLEANGHQVTFFYIDDLEGALDLPNARKIGFWDNPGFHNFDLLHTHGLRPDAWLRLHQCRIPGVTTLHNYVAEDLGLLYGRLVGRLVAPVWRWFTSKHAARVVLSADMAAYYDKRGWKKPIVVIPNSRPASEQAPDAALRKQIQDFAGDKIVLGNISHNNPRKGLGQLIDLLALDDRMVLVHIGSGQEPLLNEATLKGVRHRVLALPARPDAAAQLPLLHVFAMPSLSEGFPLALLEAVAAGVPTVASDLPVFKEAFPEYCLARFKQHDAASLREAVYQVLENPQERSDAALLYYQQHYHPDVVGRRYEQLYIRVLSGDLSV
jgi:glycosyltransferase involved in cell wall biosynthesis